MLSNNLLLILFMIIITEYCSKKEIMFGFAILNDDYQNAEWGYIDYNELRDLSISPFLLKFQRRLNYYD